jgi:hypothetical protein
MAVIFGADAAFSARIDVVRETTGLPAGTAGRKELGLDVQSRVLHLDPPEIPKSYAGFETLRKVAEAKRPIKSPAGAE